jgi:CubicO group peptidase (beta-lactamase class C family)
VRPTTRFATASLSMMFTAVGVLDTIGRRELGIDDAVVDVLPADKRPSTLRDDVTVHHLLSHTSGIADYFEEDENLPGYRDDDASLWHGSPLHELHDCAALLSLFGDLAPVCSPGITHHYSNAGDVLLGVILAEVSGMTFADAVVTRVFAPAAMTASGYPPIDEVHPTSPRTTWHRTSPVDRGARTSWPSSLSTPATPRARSSEPWHVDYGVDLRPNDAWGTDGADSGVFVISHRRPS